MKQRIVSFTDINSLPSFETWMSWPGKAVNEGKEVEVRQIEWDGKPRYLKVNCSEPLKFLLRQLFYGRRAISSPELDYTAKSRI